MTCPPHSNAPTPRAADEATASPAHAAKRARRPPLLGLKQSIHSLEISSTSSGQMDATLSRRETQWTSSAKSTHGGTETSASREYNASSYARASKERREFDSNQPRKLCWRFSPKSSAGCFFMPAGLISREVRNVAP